MTNPVKKANGKFQGKYRNSIERHKCFSTKSISCLTRYCQLVLNSIIDISSTLKLPQSNGTKCALLKKAFSKNAFSTSSRSTTPAKVVTVLFQGNEYHTSSGPGAVSNLHSAQLVENWVVKVDPTREKITLENGTACETLEIVKTVLHSFDN